MKYIILFMLMFSIGCTENIWAKQYGGNITENLPCNQKLMNITWKEVSIWTLTRPMMEEEEANTYTFRESSSFGMIEGTITIKEHKCK